MITAAATLLGAYIVAILLAMNWPGQRRHPEDGQAIGCLSLVIVALLLLEVVLAIGAYFHSRTVVKAIFYFAVFPAVLGVPQIAYALFKKWTAPRNG